MLRKHKLKRDDGKLKGWGTNRREEKEPGLGELDDESDDEEVNERKIKECKERSATDEPEGDEKSRKRWERKREKTREDAGSSLTGDGHDEKLKARERKEKKSGNPRSSLTGLSNSTVLIAPSNDDRRTDDENIGVIAEHFAAVVRSFCPHMKVKPQGVYNRVFMSGPDGGRAGNLWNVYQNMVRTEEEEVKRLSDESIEEDEMEYEKYVSAGYANFQQTYPDDWRERLQDWYAENSLILQVDGQDRKKMFAKFESSMYNFVCCLLCFLFCTDVLIP